MDGNCAQYYTMISPKSYAQLNTKHRGFDKLLNILKQPIKNYYSVQILCNLCESPICTAAASNVFACTVVDSY